jgi:hypothetical protein
MSTSRDKTATERQCKTGKYIRRERIKENKMNCTLFGIHFNYVFMILLLSNTIKNWMDKISVMIFISESNK